MPLLRISQAIGTQFKIMTADFGPIQVDLVDEALLAVSPPTFSCILDAPTGSMSTTINWRDMPAGGGGGTWSKTSSGVGANLFTLDTVTGALTCASAGLYTIAAQITFFRVNPTPPPGVEFICTAAIGVNNDIATGTSTFYPFQSQQGEDPPSAPVVAATSALGIPLLRRSVLAVGDLVRVRFRTSVNAVAPSFSIQTCQVFAWKTQ